jgi:hypothetical protein
MNPKPVSLNFSSGSDWIVIGIVSWAYGILGMVCLFLQWFFFLITGRGQQRFSDFPKGYFENVISRTQYMYFMTDNRPTVSPARVMIFVGKG